MDNCERITLIQCAKAIGEGDHGKGLVIIRRIAERMVHARSKHPIFAHDRMEAQAVVKQEMDEYVNACIVESVVRQEDEALDVIATCIRYINREYLHES